MAQRRPVNNATRPLRTAAAAARDLGTMSLWAGTGHRHATALPAGEIIEQLQPAPARSHP